MSGGIAAFVVTAIALPLALAEFGDWCPWLADRIVRWAARRLGDPVASRRYEEEWIANLNEVPGKLGRLIAALGYAACMPGMRRSISRQERCAFPAVPAGPSAAYAITSTAAPYVARIREVGIVLERLRSAADGSGPCAPFYLVGAKGIGKTTLVTFCAGMLEEVFPDGRLFLSGRAMGSAEDGLQDLLLAAGVPAAAIPSGTEGKRALLRSRLASRRILLLLDGIDPSQVPALLGTDPPCPVLVATRRAPTPALVGPQQILDLRLLSQYEAFELLHRRLGSRLDAEPEHLMDLITALNGQPLLTGLIAELMAASPSLTVAGLLAMLGDEMVDTSHCGSAAVHIVIQSLPADSRRLLLRLSLLRQAEFGPHEAALLINAVPPHAAQIIEDIAASGCLLAAREPGRYALHPAIHVYATRRLQDEESPQLIQELRDLLKRHGSVPPAASE